MKDINRNHGRIRQKVKNWEQKLASSERMIHVNRDALEVQSLDLGDSHDVKLVFKVQFGRKEAGPQLASWSN